MLAAKAKQQEDVILEFEETKKECKNLEDEIALYRKQAESVKEELKVAVWLKISYHWTFLYFTSIFVGCKAIQKLNKIFLILNCQTSHVLTLVISTNCVVAIQPNVFEGKYI